MRKSTLLLVFCISLLLLGFKDKPKKGKVNISYRLATIGFDAPDTVCVGQDIQITNLSTSINSSKWVFCKDGISQNVSGVNLGNIGNQFVRPDFLQIAKDGNNYVGFVSNDRDPNIGFVSRINFGTNIENVPTIQNLGDFGGKLNKPTNLKIIKEGNSWYCFYLNAGLLPSDYRLVRLDFGNSLLNTPTVKDFGNLGGFFSYPLEIDIIKVDNDYIGFITNLNNTLQRINFGNNILNTPTITNLGNIGNLSRPTNFKFVFFEGKWYMFLVNDNNNSITRVDFGNSLLNTPMGVNLGNPNGSLSRPLDIIPYFECGSMQALVINAANNNVVKLDFLDGVESTNISSINLGNIGSLNYPGAFSNLIYENGNKYVFVVNTLGNTLSRFKFSTCNSLGIPTSTDFNPPIFSVSDTGRFIVQLITDEGLASEYQVCKEIIVVNPKNINLGNDTTYCVNFSRVLTTGIPSTLWSTGQTGSSITVSQPGTYWAEVNQPCGKIRDSIVIGLNQSIQINIGNDTTYCGNFSRVLTTGIPSTLWSTGQTGSSITVSQPGTYWAEVTNSCGAFRDSIIINLDESVSFYLGNDTVICGNFSKTLITGLSNTIWSTGESGSQIIVGQLGTYWAEVTGDCGVYRDTIVISDKNCGCGTIEFPNAFSPNVDQINDIFKPLYTCKITYFRFMVFNRWGEKVFETNNPKEGWDGKYQGEMAPLDSYAWYCEYTYESEDKVNKAKGMVTIIR